jgi:gliding motility-associated protein GldL
MAILSKKAMNFAYGMGAAVVILGALFKLMHWPGAGIMLIIGLGTEAFIFGLSAFEAPENDLDWSLVYPELAGGEAKPKSGKKENPEEA